MSLLVATQEAIDIAFHVVADEGWGVPASYAEGFGGPLPSTADELSRAPPLVALSDLRDRPWSRRAA